MFVTLLKTFEMQNDDDYHIVLELFQNKVICKTAASKGLCNDSKVSFRFVFS